MTETNTIVGSNVNTPRTSWPWSRDTLVQNMSYMPPEESEALLALFSWCADPRHPLTRDEAANRLGFSPETIYQLMSGKYRDPDTREAKRPSAAFLKAIKEFLSTESRRFMLGKNEMVETPTAKRIYTACDLARESQTVVFIWGPSHIGKTWAVERYYAPRNNHGKTIYCRMRAASGLMGMVRAMAEAAGISNKSNTPDLIRRIKNATTPNTLWILDEVHLLANTYRKGSFFGCMEVMREIYDETECGMVLIFTILDDVKAASQQELQQLWRRGVHKVPLPDMPTRGDVAAILKHHGLDFPDKGFKVTVKGVTDEPRECIRQQARFNGLKAITERIRYAYKMASKTGSEKITWENFMEAHFTMEKQATIQKDWD